MNQTDLSDVFEGVSVVRQQRSATTVTVAHGVALVGLSDGSIQGYSSQGVQLYSFSCLHKPVLNLQYLPVLDAIVTVEGEGLLCVYRNWRSGAPGSPSRAAVVWRGDENAAAVPPVFQPDFAAMVAAVAPLADVTVAATCKVSTRIAAIVAPTTVYLCEADSNTVCVRPVLEIAVNMAPTVAALFDRYIVFAAQREVMALSFAMQPLAPSKSQQPTSEQIATTEDSAAAAAPAEDSSEELHELNLPRFVECRFDVESTGGLVFLPSIRPSPVQADGVFELRGPMAPSSLLLTLCAPAAYSAVRATLLLHRRFPITAIVTSVAALPEYPVDIDEEDPTGDAYSAVRCVIATSDAAYLYSLSRPVLLCTYPHEDRSQQVSVNACLLFSMSDTGLDTWILRTQQGLSAHGRAMPPWRISKRLMAGLSCVAVDDDIVALLSLPHLSNHSFSAKEQPALTARSVSAADDADTAGALTILSVAPSSAIAAAASACAGRAGSAGLELAALADARHILLGAPPQPPPQPPSEVGAGAAASLTARLKRKNRRMALRRAAGRLATCVLRTGDSGNAATLFARSDRLLGEVFRALQAHPGATPATLSYLDSVLFQPALADVVQDDAAVSAEVLQFYATHAPQRVSLVVLESSLPVAPAYALELLEQVMRGDSPPSPADYFAQALLYLGVGEREKAKTSLRFLSDAALVEFVAANPQLLLRPPELGQERSPQSVVAEEDVSASDAAIATPVAAAAAIATSARSSHLSRQQQQAQAPPPPPPDDVGSDDEDDMPSTASDEEPATIGDMLRLESPWLLFEALLRMRTSLSLRDALAVLRPSSAHSTIVERYLECCVRAAPSPQAAAALANAYVRRLCECASATAPMPELDDVALSVQQHLGSLPRSAALRLLATEDNVSQRFQWLDELPPFNRSVQQSAVPPAMLDWQRRLQSLLCSGAVPNPLALARRLASAPSFTGRETLKLLCMVLAGRARDCIDRIGAAYPRALGDFAVRHCATDDDWRAALAALARHGADAADTYAVLLQHVATRCAPETLLQILPACASLTHHVAAVTMVLRRSRVDAVRTVTLADALRFDASQ